MQQRNEKLSSAELYYAKITWHNERRPETKHNLAVIQSKDDLTYQVIALQHSNFHDFINDPATLISKEMRKGLQPTLDRMISFQEVYQLKKPIYFSVGQLADLVNPEYNSSTQGFYMEEIFSSTELYFANIISLDQKRQKRLESNLAIVKLAKEEEPIYDVLAIRKPKTSDVPKSFEQLFKELKQQQREPFVDKIISFHEIYQLQHPIYYTKTQLENLVNPEYQFKIQGKEYVKNKKMLSL